MFCVKCQNDLDKCVCPDIDERLAEIAKSEHNVFRMCKAEKKHYKRCKCKNPEWVTSDDETPLTLKSGEHWE